MNVLDFRVLLKDLFWLGRVGFDGEFWISPWFLLEVVEEKFLEGMRSTLS
jgi:hypothetical protein